MRLLILSLFTTLLITLGFAQEIRSTTKSNVEFSLRLISDLNILNCTDTLKVLYTVRNNSNGPIVIVDSEIKGKKPRNGMLVTKDLKIALTLGGEFGISSLGMTRKLRLIEKDQKYSIIFLLSVSDYLKEFERNRKQDGKERPQVIKDIPIYASISYSASNYWIEKVLKNLTVFSDYWESPESSNFDHPQYEEILTSFNLEGLKFTIRL